MCCLPITYHVMQKIFYENLFLKVNRATSWFKVIFIIDNLAMWILTAQQHQGEMHYKQYQWAIETIGNFYKILIFSCLEEKKRWKTLYTIFHYEISAKGYDWISSTHYYLHRNLLEHFQHNFHIFINQLWQKLLCIFFFYFAESTIYCCFLFQFGQTRTF